MMQIGASNKRIYPAGGHGGTSTQGIIIFDLKGCIGGCLVHQNDSFIGFWVFAYRAKALFHNACCYFP